ncbi:MAG: GNAT family N-acetyltransferase [Candidatus Sulfotelmatobacter sp.]
MRRPFPSPLQASGPENPKSVRVIVLRKIPDDPDLSEAWNALVLAMDNPEVFFTYEWALAASCSFQNRLSPLLFLVRDSEQLIGVAALAIDPSAQETAFFLTSSTADYCDIVSAPANRKAVLQALLTEIKKLGLTELILANVPSNSTTLRNLPSAAGSVGFYFGSRPAYDCSVVELGNDEERKVLVQTIASKSREKRAWKRLTNLGTVKVVHLAEPGQIAKGLESIVSAQIFRFLASDRISPLVGPERRAFLRLLSDLLSHSGWLKISQLEIDGQAIAWNYGFRYASSWFWYLPTFQTEFEHASPGSCLLRLLVEEAARDAALRWFDLGLGDEPYKERFASGVRQTRYVQVSRGFTRHVLAIGRQELVGLATRFPRLAGKLRGARVFWRAARGRVDEVGFAEIARRALRKAARSFASRDEVLLFEAADAQVSDDVRLQLSPLTREHLVEASILNAGDAETLGYLMRCARRLSESRLSGFVLQTGESKPLHFLWVSDYNGFHLTEIDYVLELSSPGAAMIFDCWTPAANRAQGYYAIAIRRVAARLREQGREAWIFGGASNVPSLRGILKAGFHYRFSLLRRSQLGRSSITRRQTTAALPSQSAQFQKVQPEKHYDVAV